MRCLDGSAVRLYGEGSFIGDVIGDVGFARPEVQRTAETFVEVSREQMAASPVFARLNVVQSGRTLHTTFESPLAGALSYSSPDALLYALDELVPRLAEAAAGRPVDQLAG